MRQIAPVSRSFRARSIRRSVALACIGLLLPTVAAAQEGSDDTLDGVDSIVVTITKRSESLAEVAASISAFDPQLLDDANIEHIGDALRLIPNANIKGQSGAGLGQRFRDPAAANLRHPCGIQIRRGLTSPAR